MGEGKTGKPTRRWWQIIIRAALLCALAAVAGYVTLPWWVPTSLLRNWIAGQMSEQMGVAVTIADMKLSWSNGVVLRGLRIASPKGFAAGPMAQVKTIRAEFSPWNFLANHRIGWMRIDDGKLNVRFDGRGNVNVEALSKLHFDAEPDRIDIRNASAAVRFPRQDRTFRLSVGSLQLLSGRLRRIERVTMSASLDQSDGSAPISLRAMLRPQGEPVAATTNFNFSNLDLSQLHLAKLLSLPLKRLAGRCDGSLDLQINDEGVVDHFAFRVSVKRLDVQPKAGPPLPVVDKAVFRISAVIDPLAAGGGRIDVQSLKVHMPGIDIGGSARLLMEIRGGSWEAIESLDLVGRIEPSQLAVLMTGRENFAGDFSATGPVTMRLNVARREDSVAVALSADATNVAVLEGARVVKPRGTRLSVKLAGLFDRRKWTFQADSAELLLGRNRFVGHGSLKGIRSLVGRWADAVRVTPAAVLGELAKLDWSGSWEIRGLASLASLSPVLARSLDAAVLHGEITGRWSLDNLWGTSVHVRMEMDKQASLAIPGRFVKPAGVKLGASLDAAVDPKLPGLRDMSIDAVMGTTRFSVEPATLRLANSPGPGERETDRIEGSYELTGPEFLVSCIPPLRALRGKLHGTVRGDFDIRRHPSRAMRAEVTADIGALDVNAPDAWTKPAGQRGLLKVDYNYDPRLEPAHQRRATLTGTFSKARFDATMLLPDDPSEFFPAKMDLTVRIDDAGWLARSCPPLRKWLSGGELSGPVLVNASGQYAGGQFRGQVDCVADALSLSLAQPGEKGGAPVERKKSAGVPLRLKLAVRVKPTNGATNVTIDSASLILGGSRVDLAGTITRLRGKNGPRNGKSPAGIETFRLSADVDASIDSALRNILPEISAVVTRYGIAGHAKTSVTANWDGHDVDVELRVDAGELSSKRVGPFDLVRIEPRGGLRLLDAHGKGADLASIAKKLSVPAGRLEVIRLPLWVKAKGTAARIHVSASLSRDFSKAEVTDLAVQLGEVRLRADGSVDLDSWRRKMPFRKIVRKGNLAFRIERMENLHRLVPALEPLALAGGLSVDLDYQGGDGWKIPRFRVSLNDLRGRLGGKDFSLNGRLVAQDVRPGSAGGKPGISKIRTDGVELRVGRNHFWIVGHVSGIPARPAGTVYLLGEYLDDKELSDWANRLAGKLVTRVPRKASEIDLVAKTRSEIALLRDCLGSASLIVKARIDRLRTFDRLIGESYDLNEFVLDAKIENGLVVAKYANGLSGGSVRGSMRVQLNDADPVVIEKMTMTDADATRALRKQLATFFPGNTVYGKVSRQENVGKRLVDILFSMSDPSHHPRPVGTGKTIAIDGLVEGRAAPKFVTAIFPGLNLAKYRYTKMTSFSEYLKDGTAVNDMIFRGHIYDMYMEGTTDADNIGRYEVGLILLAAPQTAEFNHSLRQGRIPILKIKARIEGGKMHDDEVSYLWPNETLFVIFLKNNIFYRLWLSAQKK